ncbi:VOC family protein [Leucobacter insecticola]|uniref:VOC family protein n=1 Tax=Leucobacter insecticola TaxID=2714934 RepID=UPI001FCAD2D7|nr:VOC family protein [Leucobacter insecticola]
MTLTFNFIGIVTRDLGASLDFYRALGLDTPEGQGSANHIEVELPGGVKLAWDPVSTIESFQPGYEFPTGPGRISFAVETDSPAGVDNTYAEVVGRFPKQPTLRRGTHPGVSGTRPSATQTATLCISTPHS